jgi:hypothetical protein
VSDARQGSFRWVAFGYGVLALTWFLAAILPVAFNGWHIDRTYVEVMGPLTLMLLLAFAVCACLAWGAWRYFALSPRARTTVAATATIAALWFAGNVVHNLWTFARSRQVFPAGVPKDIPIGAIVANVLLALVLVVYATQLVRAWLALRRGRS